MNEQERKEFEDSLNETFNLYFPEDDSMNGDDFNSFRHSEFDAEHATKTVVMQTPEDMDVFIELPIDENGNVIRRELPENERGFVAELGIPWTREDLKANGWQLDCIVYLAEEASEEAALEAALNALPDIEETMEIRQHIKVCSKHSALARGYKA